MRGSQRAKVRSLARSSAGPAGMQHGVVRGSRLHSRALLLRRSPSCSVPISVRRRTPLDHPWPVHHVSALSDAGYALVRASCVSATASTGHATTAAGPGDVLTASVIRRKSLDHRRVGGGCDRWGVGSTPANAMHRPSAKMDERSGEATSGDDPGVAHEPEIAARQR